MAESAVSHSHPLDTMLAVSDVIRNDRLAKLYARVLELDSPTVEELSEGIESSTTTIYEDVKHLVEIDLLERVTETQPYRYRASQVDMTIQAGGETFQITPTLLVALAERQSNENISLYIDRHGVSRLATAIEYGRAYTQSKMNARIMACEQEIPVLEAETILQELQEIILEAEPDISTSLNIEELDAAIDKQLDD
ncbi:helix-turn-helix domain-containing protein [Halorubrum laminariae]|uniref:Helix-turn-helix domain-containing protein n=1 Tax=Halorubrum laminariae TaxID=1433523 RepID=A0ABD6C4J3_9EURY|nr:helix-turn-helix domain-containing protein [Halorubrum laminariae]